MLILFLSQQHAMTTSFGIPNLDGPPKHHPEVPGFSRSYPSAPCITILATNDDGAVKVRNVCWVEMTDSLLWLLDRILEIEIHRHSRDIEAHV